ncbi:MAG: hypothetical protein ACK4XY_01365 [Chloroherpetonaceae bacterium]
MSDSEEISAYRKALARTIEVRKARLKTRKQVLKSELHARLTPKGLVSRFPITIMVAALGTGWFVGRAFRLLITSPSSPPIEQTQSPSSRSRTSSPLTQALKEIAFQTLTNVALNKTREILVRYLSASGTSPVRNNHTNTSKPASVKP